MARLHDGSWFPEIQSLDYPSEPHDTEAGAKESELLAMFQNLQHELWAKGAKRASTQVADAKSEYSLWKAERSRTKVS